MNEKISEELTPEELERREQEEAYEDWMKEHPRVVIPPEERREAGPEIERFEQMIADFEATYSLEELHAITELTFETAKDHPLRAPANKAISPIVTLLNALEEETDISPERHDALKAEYRRLSRAVGVIGKDDKVDHTKPH